MSLPVLEPSARTDAGPPVFNRIGIVGLGLIGGSIALAARELWPSARVTGVDNPEVLDTAIRMHAVDVAAHDLAALSEVDLVILAAPVRQIRDLLAQLDAHMRQPALITDTGSTKRDIVAAARSLPDRLVFIGGHPLGGAAVGGLAHARPDLFRNRPWLFTPSAGVPPEALEKLTAFVSALGSAPSIMSAEDHDVLLAFLSHLPQLTVSALMSLVGATVQESGLALAGRGLMDTTRLASSPPEIWRDIAAANADHLGTALDALIGVLQTLRADLAAGERLADVFASAVAWREKLTSGSKL